MSRVHAGSSAKKTLRQHPTRRLQRRALPSFPLPHTNHPTSSLLRDKTMAKVSASASASGQAARATPDAESAVAPAKTTRATRGQSREPQQNQRRSARNARSASVEGETSPAQVVRNAAETGMCNNLFLENNPIPSTLAQYTLPTLNPLVYSHPVVRRGCCCTHLSCIASWRCARVLKRFPRCMNRSQQRLTSYRSSHSQRRHR